jgi:hypothetical protein
MPRQHPKRFDNQTANRPPKWVNSNQQLGQLLEQAVLANQVFRLLVVGQQARQQFFGTTCFLVLIVWTDYGAHAPREIVRLHKILHTLFKPTLQA